MGRWTEDEVEYLKANCSELLASEIADYLNRSVQSVYSKVKHLDIQLDNKWRKKEKEYVRRNYEDTPAREIAEHLGRTKDAIISFANREGLTKMEQRKWTEKEREFLEGNAQKMSANEIGQELNRTESSVKHFAERHNISLDKPRSVYADKISKGRREYDFNENFFAEDTPEANYWAGALLADGCVRERDENSHTISLEISKKDRSWLEKFKTSLSAENPIFIDGDFIGLKIHSSKMFSDLNKFGVIPRKTYKDIRPSVNDNMLHHFIRGLLDGDGSITQNSNRTKLNLVNNESICNWVNNEIEKQLGISGTLYPYKHSDVAWNWETSNKNYISDIAKWLYNNAELFMNRKYERYVNYNIISGSEVKV